MVSILPQYIFDALRVKLKIQLTLKRLQILPNDVVHGSTVIGALKTNFPHDLYRVAFIAVFPLYFCFAV